jgi:hypothetical protein
MTLELPGISVGPLTAECRLVDKSVIVLFSGTADTEARAELETFIAQLRSEANRIGVTGVAIDFRDLVFMNSSCLKIFVVWLAALRDLPCDKQYRIRIRSNPSLLWQRRSLAALSCFAADLVTIET